MLGASCLIQFCGPCMTVMRYEYTVSDLNDTNIISLIKEEISNLLKICSHTPIQIAIHFHQLFSIIA